jgi:hypothetical protein
MKLVHETHKPDKKENKNYKVKKITRELGIS